MGIRYGFSNYERRIDACRNALDEVGAPFYRKWIVERLENHHATKQLFSVWLEKHPECTAVFAADYTSALILLEIFQEKGIRIPEELSLFASGEAPSASMLKVSLSTVVQPFIELGKRAVFRLLDEQWELGTELLPCRLMIREWGVAMSRRAFLIHIREGMAEEYKKRHREVWPGVIEALKANGVYNYSIFLKGNTLFAYMEMEGDFEEGFRKLHQDPASIRWRDFMSDIILRDANFGFHFLEEVFHLN